MEEPKPRRSRIIIRKTKKQSENSFKNFTPSKDVNVNQSKYLYTNCIKIVENTKKRLQQNANYDMCIDNMLFNMWEEVI